jgi:hypothetical protein
MLHVLREVLVYRERGKRGEGRYEREVLCVVEEGREDGRSEREVMVCRGRKKRNRMKEKCWCAL